MPSIGRVATVAPAASSGTADLLGRGGDDPRRGRAVPRCARGAVRHPSPTGAFTVTASPGSGSRSRSSVRNSTTAPWVRSPSGPEAATDRAQRERRPATARRRRSRRRPSAIVPGASCPRRRRPRRARRRGRAHAVPSPPRWGRPTPTGRPPADAPEGRHAGHREHERGGDADHHRGADRREEAMLAAEQRGPDRAAAPRRRGGRSSTAADAGHDEADGGRPGGGAGRGDSHEADQHGHEREQGGHGAGRASARATVVTRATNKVTVPTRSAVRGLGHSVESRRGTPWTTASTTSSGTCPPASRTASTTAATTAEHGRHDGGRAPPPQPERRATTAEDRTQQEDRPDAVEDPPGRQRQHHGHDGDERGARRGSAPRTPPLGEGAGVLHRQRWPRRASGWPRARRATTTM